MLFCKRCATTLNNDYTCSNESCDFKDHLQDCDAGFNDHPNSHQKKGCCTCNLSKPIDSQDYHMMAKGVRIIPKAQNVQINLPNGNDSCRLDVIHHDGSSKGYRISKRVAEVLIAEGYSWGD